MGFLKSRRTWLATAVVLILAVIALWPSSTLVDTARVDRGTVRATVDAEGRTRVIDRYVISAPVAATARRLLLEPGDQVSAGQELVALDPLAAAPLDRRSRGSAEAAVAAAQSRLAGAEQQQRAAEARAEQAQADATRLQALVARGLVAVDAAEHARTEREIAERALASARFARATAAHEVEVAEAALTFGEDSGETTGGLLLHSPVEGVVLRRHFESARPVQPGDPLVEVGDPSRLEVEADVLSSDAVRLREGMAVEMLRWGEPEPLPGRVQRIEPGGFTKFSALGVEEQRVWVVVDLTSPREHWQRLGDAYRVNVRFILQQADNALRVPTSAVFRDGEGHAVFVVESGRARQTPVRIGLQGGGHTELRGGIADDVTVVVHPDRSLQDGDRVDAR